MVALPPHEIEQAVLQVLAGLPRREVSNRWCLAPVDLTAAVETYRSGGRAALEREVADEGWLQFDILGRDWREAEAAVCVLRPELRHAVESRVMAAWWFTRKADRWRVRCRPVEVAESAPVVGLMTKALDGLRARGDILGWSRGHYEPETVAFGGARAMDAAHVLFHEDSAHILDRVAGAESRRIGMTELSVLLCSLLCRSAGLDWYEQGDVWARVATHRPSGATVAPGADADLRRLMTVDAGPDSKLVTKGALRSCAGWARAFAEAGAALGDLARTGLLERGLRAVVCHHVLLHWNRSGMSVDVQGAVAHRAREVVMGA